MDITYFAKNRISFIENMYDKATSPFTDVIYKIENEIYPYIPSYSEYNEPALFNEWSDAQDSINIIGLQSVSLLAASLQLFFKAWIKNIYRLNPASKTKSLKNESSYQKEFKKSGWLIGYMALLKKEYNIDLNDSNVNLTLIEELILVRNRIQHPDEITTLDSFYSASDLEKLKNPSFVISTGNDSLQESELYAILKPRIRIEPIQFHQLVNELNKLVDWLEPKQTKWSKNV
jgi:hypothetical protein